MNPIDPPRTYVLVGAGGTGSALIDPLLRYLDTFHREAEDFRLAVIDGDTVEPKNLDRQAFFGSDVQTNKAHALVNRYDDQRLRAVSRYLDQEHLATDVQEDDTILIAVDNYAVRARIERQALTLRNVTIINGGNELTDGSVQVYLRRNGQSLTPPLSFEHPEILRDDAERDPTRLSCQQLAQLPGGEQTILANLASALYMLNALRHVHAWEAAGNWENDGSFPFTELYFDLETNRTLPHDLREIKQWYEYQPPNEALHAI